MVRYHDNRVVSMLIAILVRLWAMPYTLLGLVFVVLARLTGGTVQAHTGVLEAYGGFAKWWLANAVLLKGGAAAQTFGHVVIAQDERYLESTRVHERVHTRQYEILGPLFIPAYLLSSLWAILRREHAYHGNLMEQVAVAEAAEAQMRRVVEARGPVPEPGDSTKGESRVSAQRGSSDSQSSSRSSTT